MLKSTLEVGIGKTGVGSFPDVKKIRTPLTSCVGVVIPTENTLGEPIVGVAHISHPGEATELIDQTLAEIKQQGGDLREKVIARVYGGNLTNPKREQHYGPINLEATKKALQKRRIGIKEIGTSKEGFGDYLTVCLETRRILNKIQPLANWQKNTR